MPHPPGCTDTPPAGSRAASNSPLCGISARCPTGRIECRPLPAGGLPGIRCTEVRPPTDAGQESPEPGRCTDPRPGRTGHRRGCTEGRLPIFDARRAGQPLPPARESAGTVSRTGPCPDLLTALAGLHRSPTGCAPNADLAAPNPDRAAPKADADARFPHRVGLTRPCRVASRRAGLAAVGRRHWMGAFGNGAAGDGEVGAGARMVATPSGDRRRQVQRPRRARHVCRRGGLLRSVSGDCRTLAAAQQAMGEQGGGGTCA
jgi:hypothetical protein